MLEGGGGGGGGIGSLHPVCMIGGQQVFALCLEVSLHFKLHTMFRCGCFQGLSASVNDPSNVAAGAVCVCCSRVVCMVCRLSIPSSGTYIRFSLRILYINLIYSVNLSQESIFIRLRFRRLYFGLFHPVTAHCIFTLGVK